MQAGALPRLDSAFPSPGAGRRSILRAAREGGRGSSNRQEQRGRRRAANSSELALTGDQHWADTTIDVKAGERIQVSAKGTLRCAEAQQENGPEGLPRGFRDLLRILPLNQAGRGALIGRIGDADIAEPFLIGPKIEILARVHGRLFLGINQQNEEEAEGSFTVTIDVLAASASSTNSAVPLATSISGLTPDFLR